MTHAKFLYQLSDKIAALEDSNGFCFIYLSRNSNTESEAINLLEKMIVDGMKLDKNKAYILPINLYHKIRIPNDATKIILLGVLPNQVGLGIKTIQNKIINLKNKQYLFSFSIEEIIKDQQKKKIMWAEIQKMMI